MATAFVEAMLGSKSEIHLVSANDMRDFAIRNLWIGLLLAEKQFGKKIKYETKIRMIQRVCHDIGEAIGEKNISRILNGVNLEYYRKYKPRAGQFNE